MITSEFKAQVQALRDEGLNWAQVSKRAGRPVRTCKRAIHVGQPRDECARRGCHEKRLPSGKFCDEHAREAMGNRRGSGGRQAEVMKLMNKHGHLTSEELRTLTGLTSDHLGHVVSRLVKLGKIERPLMGHYTLPRAPEAKPEHPIPPPGDGLYK